MPRNKPVTDKIVFIHLKEYSNGNGESKKNRENGVKSLEELETEETQYYLFSYKKSQDLFSVLGLQSSEGFNNLDFNIIVHQSRNIASENDAKLTNQYRDNKNTSDV